MEEYTGSVATNTALSIDTVATNKANLDVFVFEKLAVTIAFVWLSPR